MKTHPGFGPFAQGSESNFALTPLSYEICQTLFTVTSGCCFTQTRGSPPRTPHGSGIILAPPVSAARRLYESISLSFPGHFVRSHVRNRQRLRRYRLPLSTRTSVAEAFLSLLSPSLTLLTGHVFARYRAHGDEETPATAKRVIFESIKQALESELA